LMCIVGGVVSAVVIAPILSELYSAYGIGGSFPRSGMDPTQALQAPQATLMSSVAKGVFSGGLPWVMIGIGGVIAVGIIVLDQVLLRRGARFHTPVLAVAVGLYLPLELSTPILVGGIVSLVAARARRIHNDTAASEQRGLLFASGLMTGEALVGIILAVPFAIAQSAEVFALEPSMLGLSEPGFTVLTNVLGIGAFVAFALWLWRTAQRRDTAE